MPSPLKTTQRRALTLIRSLVTNFNRISTILSPGNHESCSPLHYISPSAPRTTAISRPRHLRRAYLSAFHFVQLHFIHRLPLEILAHIFVLGSEDNIMLPVTVSHVCRSWRQIALHTPSLWRRISLSPNECMWRERIHRARACSLDIQLFPYAASRSESFVPQHLDAHSVQWYMHMALPSIARWRSLQIMFSDFAPSLWNAALSGICFPDHELQVSALEELLLVYHANDDTKEFRLFSDYAPRLRRVTLDGIRLAWLPSLFGNITYLNYTHHGFTAGPEAVRDVMSILVVSARLIELHILFPRKNLPNRSISLVENTSTIPISLPNLLHLYLRVEGNDIPFELGHLMAHLATPSLQTLSLLDMSRRYHSFPNLKLFFYVFSLPPSLRVLRIEHGWFDQRMLSPAIYGLPYLQKILIRRPHVPDQVLNINPRNRKQLHNDNRSHRHFHIAHRDAINLWKPPRL